MHFKTEWLGKPITAMLKMDTNGLKPGGLWLSDLYQMAQLRGLSASAMIDLHPRSGRWNFKAISRLETDNNWLDTSLIGQVCEWSHPIKLST